MTTETYRRGQVEWAIWQVMASDASKAGSPPKAFVTRIKRLLELDRAETEDRPGLAFTDTAPAGQGTDRAFTPFDALCLALALELIDMGFKQAEVVFLLQHCRKELSPVYEKIMRRPKPNRRRVHPRNDPDAPTYQVRGSRWVDRRFFMVIGKVEMTELFPRLEAQIKAGEPVFLRPAYLEGVDKLASYLNERLGFRKSLVLEISGPAREVNAQLPLAPEIKRGR